MQLKQNLSQAWQYCINVARNLIIKIQKVWKYNWGIRSRVLILVLAPAVGIAFALSFFFVNTQINDLEQSLLDRAKIQINQLAHAASHQKIIEDNEKLIFLVKTALIEADVIQIIVKDERGLTVVNESTPLDQQTRDAGKLMYKAPIVHTVFTRLSKEKKETISDTKTLGWVFVYFSRKGVAARKKTIVIEGLFITLIGLFISTFLALRLGKNVTEPIIRLTDTVKNIAEGKPNTRVQRSSTGEIGTLEQGINSMSNEVEKTHKYLHGKIEIATQQLRATLSELELQNEELDKARLQALDASLIKTEFLANMSHEIRTPLNGILGFSNLLLKSSVNETQKDHILTIKNSTMALLTVINDTLDFSQIEAGQFSIDNISFNLREVIEDAVTLLTPNAYNKGLDIILMLYSDVPKRLISDPVRIRQIITSLASNAIKFTNKGSITIRIMLEEENDNGVILKVSVQDTGIGISKKGQQDLFDPYVHSKKPGEGHYSSVRLGLVICKKLVESMGGEIGIDSKLREGSTFWFTFTVKIDTNEVQCLTEFNPLSTYRCLLYDRNELSRLAIIHQISDWGIEISETDQFAEIAKLLANPVKYDNRNSLAILALDKNELETNQFRKLTRAIKNPRETPIIIMATSVNKELYKSLVNQGASLVVPKTIRVQHFYGKLCDMLLSSSNPDELADESNKPVLNYEPEFSNITFLVVDDNDVNRRLIQVLLEERKGKIIEAKNGQEAVDLFATQHIDLVIMDIQMPVMSGLEAAKKIRAMEHGQKRTPVIALTANIIDGDQDRFVSAGFDDILVKPVHEANLFEITASWLNIEKPLSKVESEKADIRIPAIPKKQRAAPAVSELFDHNQALRLTGGNIELANELFQMLVNDLPNMKNNLNQSLNPLNYKKLETVAHKIHGAASYCAVLTLKQSAAQVEKAARLNMDRDIYRFVKSLNKDIDRILQTKQ